MTQRVTLRQVRPEDVPACYAYQSDRQARELAAVPPRDRPAFDAHWRRIIARRHIIQVGSGHEPRRLTPLTELLSGLIDQYS